MKTLEQFYPLILPAVLGCPTPVLDANLILAAREFCQKTSALRYWLDTVTADGTTNTFDHDLTSNQELVRVTRCLYTQDTDYGIMSQRDLPRDWETGDSGWLYQTLVQFDNGQTYKMYPAPVAGDTFTLQIAVKPSIAATALDDDLYNKWAEALAHGTKQRLMIMPRQAWSDPTLSQYHGMEFNKALASAANEDFKQRKNKGTKIHGQNRNVLWWNRWQP